MLTDRRCRKSTSKKEYSNKCLYKILGTEISSYEEFHCKTRQISKEMNYIYQNENSLDSLASNMTSDIV